MYLLVRVFNKMHLSLSPRRDKMVSGVARYLLVQFFAGLLIFFFLGVSLAFPSAASSLGPPDRVIALGDVHGDFVNVCAILRWIHLIDEQNHWTGGNTTLVQTGDLIDRGAKGLEVMDLFMTLQTEATKAGGNVVLLLGNHEVMNIVGDVRYVAPATYASFADHESESRRKAAYQAYAAWVAAHEKVLAAITEPTLPTSEQDWMAQHPAGFVEYREAFSSEGKYGKWIRQHPAVARIGADIFSHGGISPALVSMSLEQINSQVREEIETFDKTMQELVSRKVVLPFFTIREVILAVQLELLQQQSSNTPPDAEYHKRLEQMRNFKNWLSTRDDGPLWFRGYDGWNDQEGDQQVRKILASYGANHFVVAHTVQKTHHIRSRFGGSVFLIDTGMLSSYWPGGRASALQIQKDGKFIAQYLDGQEVLWDEKHPAPVAKPN